MVTEFPMSSELVVGVFVGGRSSRMGSPKGLLSAPEGAGLTLVERLLREIEGALPGVSCVLVGRRPEYRALERPQIEDAALEKGPLGGLVALLEFAKMHRREAALAIACDFPFLRAGLIRRLACEHPEARLLCPWLDERHQPLFARYTVELLPEFSSALAREELALMPLVNNARPTELLLSQSERAQLVDWDRPEDITKVPGSELF